MTQVHADHSHILCLFEDVQYHLEELGFPSSIREGKIFVRWDDRDWELIDSTIEEHTVRFKFDDLDTYLPYLGDPLSDFSITLQRSAFRLLYDLLPRYLELSYGADNATS
jgi:hypothetical protein